MNQRTRGLFLVASCILLLSGCITTIACGGREVSVDGKVSNRVTSEPVGDAQLLFSLKYGARARIEDVEYATSDEAGKIAFDGWVNWSERYGLGNRLKGTLKRADGGPGIFSVKVAAPGFESHVVEYSTEVAFASQSSPFRINLGEVLLEPLKDGEKTTP